MASTWATKPAGTADLTGQRFGPIEVVRVASSQPLMKWVVRCLKPYCNSEWVERHEKIVNGAMRCRNLACDLGRLEAPKVSRYEQELGRVEPEKQPEPAPVPVVKQVQPSPEYQKYRRHAVIKWGYTSGDGRLIEYADWQQLPEFAKEKMLAIIAKEEK